MSLQHAFHVIVVVVVVAVAADVSKMFSILTTAATATYLLRAEHTYKIYNVHGRASFCLSLLAGWYAVPTIHSWIRMG